MNALKLNVMTEDDLGPMNGRAPVLEWPLSDDDDSLNAFASEQPDTVILPIPCQELLELIAQHQVGRESVQRNAPPLPGPELLELNAIPLPSPERFECYSPSLCDPEVLEHNPTSLPGPKLSELNTIVLVRSEILERYPTALPGPEALERDPTPFPGVNPLELNTMPLVRPELLERHPTPPTGPTLLDEPTPFPGPELPEPHSTPLPGPELLERYTSPLPAPELLESNPLPLPGPTPPEPAAVWPIRNLRVSWPLLLLIVAATLETLYIGFELVGQYRRPAHTAEQSVLPARLLANPMATSLPAPPLKLRNPPAETKPRPVEAPRPEQRLTREPVEAPAADPPGWVTIELPIQVQVFERGRFVGSNDTGRLMLSAGFHELEFVNESLQLRSRQTVYVGSGKVVPIQVPLPSGTLSINALPWSDVLIDGRSVGATPLGHVQLSIGPHQLVFRHPQLGEQTRIAVVTASAETRVTVDLRK